jgi:hypothetical protein
VLTTGTTQHKSKQIHILSGKRKSFHATVTGGKKRQRGQGEMEFNVALPGVVDNGGSTSSGTQGLKTRREEAGRDYCSGAKGAGGAAIIGSQKQNQQQKLRQDQQQTQQQHQQQHQQQPPPQNCTRAASVPVCAQPIKCHCVQMGLKPCGKRLDYCINRMKCVPPVHVRKVRKKTECACITDGKPPCGKPPSKCIRKHRNKHKRKVYCDSIIDESSKLGNNIRIGRPQTKQDHHTPYCIAHGGGKVCESEGCTKSAQGATPYCIAHGGGKVCESEGCTKSAQGATPYCIAHDGGRRCESEGCTKSAQGATPFCKAHGGGKRCEREGCTTAARSGMLPYCIRHGGGKRCIFNECSRQAPRKSDFCKMHRI